MPADEKRDLLSTEDLDEAEVQNLCDLADRIDKRGPADLLKGKTLGLIFLDRSLRTRVSFEVAMTQLGGHCITLAPDRDLYEVEAGTETVMDGVAPEHVKDAARNLSSYLDGLALRSGRSTGDWAIDREEALLRGYARFSSVPVINLQSPMAHPCQALADIFTMKNRVRNLQGRRLSLCWTQDPSSQGPGIPHSLVLLATRLGMQVTLVHPQGFELDEEVLAKARGHSSRSRGSLRVSHDLEDGARGADFLYARSWQSLHCSPDREALLKRSLDSWIVTADLLALGNRAWLMQPLPVRRNLSVTDEVLDGPRSLVYVQAQNRLPIQKALLLHLL